MSTSSAPSVAAAAAAAWKTADLSQQLCEFVNRSPSPFHAVAESRRMLEAAGFAQLREDQSWSLRPNQKGFVTRNGSTIFAFATGGKWKPGNGFSIVGAHTDSPCLRLKPVSLRESAGELLQCGVETYGGGLWYSWFDRDLTVAGRVIVRSGSGGSSDSSRLTERLVNLEAPVFKVPSLAIHLNRTVNDEGFAPNKENHLAPILCRKLAADASGAGTGSDTSAPPQRHPVGLLARIAEKLGCQPADILDWDLYLADTQPAAVTGLNGDFVSSPRLDNLLSCYSALTALIEAPGLESDPNCRVVCLYDHEEIGSESAQGAGSALTLHFLRRLSQGAEFETAVPKSLLVSADVAHAVHPNYEEKHERKHRPSLFGGVVIKENANQRYATNCLTSSLLRECLRLSDPAAQLQDFVIRQDMACGSTIGPILAAKVGLPTIDVGSPIFGMHSIRETGAAAAPGQGVQLFSAFFKHFPALREAMETQ
ncbi:hypothetical protein BOX15_Mlig027326g1 [Macrostomum lignano]|uniref:Aspartyl aminopeptidase n=1 Tax=Macrostomum lignano TaxID=282301 RepID=A0A267GXU3_9PLAT|nr:hypothetical protein BOX15_Mlig027326g1 [Macrostomum lignano]